MSRNLLWSVCHNVRSMWMIKAIVRSDNISSHPQVQSCVSVQRVRPHHKQMLALYHRSQCNWPWSYLIFDTHLLLATYSIGTEDSFPGRRSRRDKWTRRESDYSSLSSTEITNEWSNTSTPQICLQSMYRFKFDYRSSILRYWRSTSISHKSVTIFLQCDHRRFRGRRSNTSTPQICLQSVYRFKFDYHSSIIRYWRSISISHKSVTMFWQRDHRCFRGTHCRHIISNESDHKMNIHFHDNANTVMFLAKFPLNSKGRYYKFNVVHIPCNWLTTKYLFQLTAYIIITNYFTIYIHQLDATLFKKNCIVF
jgi:hypothetical protein